MTPRRPASRPATAPPGAGAGPRRRALAAVAWAGVLLACALGGAAGARAERPPAAAYGLTFRDPHEFGGRALGLRWTRSPDDSAGGGIVSGYVVERAPAPGGPWSVVRTTPAGVDSLLDAAVVRDTPYFYRVVTVGPGGRTPAGACAGPAVAHAAWYYPTRGRLLALAGVLAIVALNVVAFGRGRERAAPPAA